MNYFAVQVKTSFEEDFILRLSQQTDTQTAGIRYIFPKRFLPVRADGKTKKTYQPLFPGYFFIEAEEIDKYLYNIVRHTPGFYRFLPDNQHIQKLQNRDLALLSHFLGFGETIESSLVEFDENDKITILKGPLKGLEAMIIKVDRRKKRVKLKVDFGDSPIKIDLSYECVEKKTDYITADTKHGV